MPKNKLTGAEIRKQFIDFFLQRGHTFVPSSPVVPGGDQTLLFTNAGMVQFKDVFLGTDERSYNRAVNSQKCMRVAGKHNDLEEVGSDDTHHTFFEMLGNWSFGDYYKKEAIAWAWELLTDIWELPKERLYATVFKDEQDEIPTDEEAAKYWLQQPGFLPDHLFYLGRKDNFWEMAETGPCGPNSEIHIDLRPQDGPVGIEDLDTDRFIELWNLVFMQYNRVGPSHLNPLPATHVDTGLGFERIVSILQGVSSNYRTDLFWPIILKTQQLSGQSDAQREAQFTPYRVIADHARAAVFLIADGVVPGNMGRNYISRMIIRRAARFGSKIGLNQPFLAKVAETVIDIYGKAYPELIKNRASILDNLTREEQRFQRTVEGGTAHLENLLAQLQTSGGNLLDGKLAFDLYSTYGLPLEITRDIARERGLDVDDAGFRQAMEAHRVASGAGQAMGALGGEDVDIYRDLLDKLQKDGTLSAQGVSYDPYTQPETEGTLLAMVRNGTPVQQAQQGDRVAVILPATGFYVESGGQVSDSGLIKSADGTNWQIRVDEMRKPAAGVIVHIGEVIAGAPKVGDKAFAAVNHQRRADIMRNHTATHLLHAELHAVLGEHARQAGSLVAPDRLRFDFTHSEPLTEQEIAQIESGVNRAILAGFAVQFNQQSRKEAIQSGAMALFGEKYGEVVRTIAIGKPNVFSYELCGGTHLENTSQIGIFLITSESSVGTGIRRIEAVTGRAAYALIHQRFGLLKETAALLAAPPEETPQKAAALQADLSAAHRQIAELRRELSALAFESHLEQPPLVHGVPVLTAILPNADSDTLRQMADRFRQKHPSGTVVLATITDHRPLLIAAVTEDLTRRGLHAGQLVKFVAQQVGGGGGGKPTLAQAGGKNAQNIDQALASVTGWVEEHLQK